MALRKRWPGVPVAEQGFSRHRFSRVPAVQKARRNLPSINLNIQQYPTQNKLAPMMAAK
jgi:hypothetical protein